MNRAGNRSFPAAPATWDASSRETWANLIKLLGSSGLFDTGRRTRPAFIVQGTVSAPVTLDVNNPSVTVLTHVVGKLLNALERSQFVDVR